jgi:DDE superfamily endonuclease
MIDQPLPRAVECLDVLLFVFFGTNRMFRCCTAVQIASASLLSFFCRRTNGFTYCEAIKPHRLERYMASDDPDFERKAADVIGLYVNPPQHAAVFCVDEKTAIQALDRLDPVLPLSPGRAERHGFEYYRHGTLSLYAALNTKSGKVLGQTAAHHTTEELVAFLGQIVALQPRGREIHIIADNLSAHKTKRVTQFLADHPKLTCILLRPIPRGSIRSNSGSAASNAMWSPAGSSPRSTTWRASSCVTSVITTNTPRPSNGPTATSQTESSLLPLQLLQATSSD